MKRLICKNNLNKKQHNLGKLFLTDFFYIKSLYSGQVSGFPLGSVGSSSGPTRPAWHTAGHHGCCSQGNQSGLLGSAGEEPEEDHTPFPDAARRLTRNAAGRGEQKRSQEVLWAEGTRWGRAQSGRCCLASRPAGWGFQKRAVR